MIDTRTLYEPIYRRWAGPVVFAEDELISASQAISALRRLKAPQREIRISLRTGRPTGPCFLSECQRKSLHSAYHAGRSQKDHNDANFIFESEYDRVIVHLSVKGYEPDAADPI